MQSDAARSRRDTYLGIAAATTAVGYILGVSANITYFARGRIGFFGSALSATVWLLQVCGLALLVVGFAAIATAFFGRGDARGPRLRRGALVVTGGYCVILVSGAPALLLYYRNAELVPPAQFQGSMILQVAAYLPALIAALLVATAFVRPGGTPGMEAAARERRLGWASIGFGIEFALLLLSRLLTGSPILATLDLWAVTPLLALAAAVVAAIGFFGAARAPRSPSPGPLPRREGVLAIAAMLFLLYRVLDLTDLRDLASWLWRLESVALAVAALCAAIGFVVSRRVFLGHDYPSLISGDE